MDELIAFGMGCAASIGCALLSWFIVWMWGDRMYPNKEPGFYTIRRK